MERCVVNGVVEGLRFCNIEKNEWKRRAEVVLRKSDPVVEAFLLCPFSREVTNVSLKLVTTSSRFGFGCRILTSPDRAAAELLGVEETGLAASPLLEDLRNGDYVMCICVALGEWSFGKRAQNVLRHKTHVHGG